MSSSASSLMLYYNILSQPSRTLKIFLDSNKIQYIAKNMNLLQGEHLQEEFTRINPFKKVPVVVHNNLVLTESRALHPEYLDISVETLSGLFGWGLKKSVAIVRYLCREYDIPEHWYPKESVKQFKVDEFLEWHHLELRYPCAMYFREKFLLPMITGKPAMKERVSLFFKLTEIACDKMEENWLNQRNYLCGDEITVADLFGATELEQTKMAGYEPRKGRPILAKWLERVENRLSPHYTIAHNYINGISEKHHGVVPESVSKL